VLSADGLFNFVVAAFAEAQPEVTDEGTPCGELPHVMLSNSVDPGAGEVGDSVSFTYTVTNPGAVPLTDVLVESALPAASTS
jgi:uncharacterized repeat protein (TIGR01451 family)